MGIDKQLHEVQELMDSVDKDGSGECDRSASLQPAVMKGHQAFRA